MQLLPGHADVIQWIATVLGLVGAMLATQRSARARAYGFTAWIGSNIGLITLFWGNTPLFLLYFSYLLIAVWGCRTNFILMAEKKNNACGPDEADTDEDQASKS